MHYSDYLQGLPEDCVGKPEVLKPGRADNLNIFPATPQPRYTSEEFERSVQSAEQDLEQKKELGEQLRSRAEQLSQNYQQAVVDKNRARRSWDYSSREIVKKADEDMAEARVSRQELLAELDNARISTKEKAEIRGILQGVESE